MEALSRCNNCLRLSQTINGQCIFEDCPDSKRREGRAQLLMGLRGYRIHSGRLWVVLNDDPENFDEIRIADWRGTHTDAYLNLALHDFPTSSFLICPACGDGEVVEFGGLCAFCERANLEAERAGV